MAWRSPTEINWSKGAGESINYVNEVTNNIFSNMLLFSLYIIILWGSYKASDDILSDFAIASWSVMIIGLIMWIGSWVTWVTFAVCVGLAIVSAAAVLINN